MATAPFRLPTQRRPLSARTTDREPKLLTRELAEQADVVVTMGWGDECPYIPGGRYVDIDRRMRQLVEKLDA